jgi:hypothetical protein
MTSKYLTGSLPARKAIDSLAIGFVAVAGVLQRPLQLSSPARLLAAFRDCARLSSLAKHIYT